MTSGGLRRAPLEVGQGAQGVGRGARGPVAEKEDAGRERSGKRRRAEGVNMGSFEYHRALTQIGRAYASSQAGRSS